MENSKRNTPNQTKQWLLVIAIAVALLAVAVGIVLGIGLFSDDSVVRADEENQIAIGQNHMLAIGSNGRLYAWGHNKQGELGDITIENRYEPVAITSKIGTSGVASAAAGDEVSFAVKKNGDLYAWGDNSSYQMGDGINISRMEPEKVMENVQTVAAGGSHAMAIKKDGSLYVWGNDAHFQLGITANQCDRKNEKGEACLSKPTKLMDDVTAISCGENYSMAVTRDGTLYAWGTDDYGQLGIGGSANGKDADGYAYQITPVKVMEKVAAVACGYRCQCLALTTDGEVYAWGTNTVGSVGAERVDDAENNRQTVPTKVLSGIKQIAAGNAHSLALSENGELYVWGANNSGQLTFQKGDKTYAVGEETVYYQSTPKKVKDGIARIAAGGNESAYVTEEGILYTVGSNWYGELGVGQEEKTSIATPAAPALK